MGGTSRHHLRATFLAPVGGCRLHAFAEWRMDGDQALQVGLWRLAGIDGEHLAGSSSFPASEVFPIHSPRNAPPAAERHMNPWTITVISLTTTAVAVVINLILFGVRAGRYDQRFTYHTEELRSQADDIEELQKEVMLLKLRFAAFTGKTNGG
jgi:hypothetical protein